MAITKSTTSVTLQERTYRIEISVPYGQDPDIYAYRANAWIDDKSALIQEQPIEALVHRKASAIQAQQFTAAGVTVTGAQLYALLAAVADTWAQEDAQTPPA